MTTINLYDAICQLTERKQYPTTIQDVFKIILMQDAPSIRLFEYMEENKISSEEIKGQIIDVILDYAELILEDDILTKTEINNIHALRKFFFIEDGEFIEYGKRDRVEAILIEQLEKLYADKKIDKEEMLHKSELQGLFGLGYDDYLDIVNKVAIEAYSRGADLKDLDTYL